MDWALINMKEISEILLTQVDICYILFIQTNNCYSTKRRGKWMAHYREGYELYCKKWEQFNLEPINFYYYMNKLSQEQLEFYNEAAHERKLLA